MAAEKIFHAAADVVGEGSAYRQLITWFPLSPSNTRIEERFQLRVSRLEVISEIELVHVDVCARQEDRASSRDQVSVDVCRLMIELELSLKIGPDRVVRLKAIINAAFDRQIIERRVRWKLDLSAELIAAEWSYLKFMLSERARRGDQRQQQGNEQGIAPRHVDLLELNTIEHQSEWKVACQVYLSEAGLGWVRTCTVMRCTGGRIGYGDPRNNPLPPK